MVGSTGSFLATSLGMSHFEEGPNWLLLLRMRQVEEGAAEKPPTSHLPHHWTAHLPGLLLRFSMSSPFFVYNGILFPTALSSAESLTYLEKEFRFLDDDLLSVSYPKSGGHWMAEILSAIQQEWDPSWVCSEKITWIETFDGMKTALKYPPPRILASHLPINLFPKTFLESKAKVIYTLRNPKDVLVLFYHCYKKWKDPGSLDEFLEEFLDGNVSHGSWFDHVKGWLQMKKRENFLFITVEELKQDLRGSVEKICQFLGKELNSQQIDSVADNPSFQKVKNETMPISSRKRGSVSMHIKQPLVLTGLPGDWKNHVTVAQNERFDRFYPSHIKGVGVSFPWD
ncbi:sulfotransferase 2A1-like isoform X1 [Podarcis raffonei]|uniref:sulfotransferase 2A1-like isoform X1 n=2 Tax=Podarcis raffonei TaxID=65483 RepID=UPI0023292D49|nr:sulfotransferase 2A1-like isoform X1 [Podarcis raffonei]